MHILVCIKQVPDAESKPVITDDGHWAHYNKNTAYRINRFDEHAIEEALLIKELFPGTEIDTLSIGPERVKTAIRRAMEMGADRGFHIPFSDDGYISPSQKAHAIADFCREKTYELVIAGVMSEDMMSGQTGPMTAALLGYPSATSVIRLQVENTGNRIYVERELDGSSRCAMSLRLPALVTVQSGINRPRYPSLSNVLRAKTEVITEIVPRTGGDKMPFESVKKIINTRSTRAGIILRGSTIEKAELLWKMLHEKSLI